MVLRTESESSDFADLELAGVEPLTLEDIVIGESYVNTQTVRYVDTTQRWRISNQRNQFIGKTVSTTYYQGGYLSVPLFFLL